MDLRDNGEKDAKWDFEAATRSGNSRKVTPCRHSPVAASRRNEFLEVPSNITTPTGSHVGRNEKLCRSEKTNG